MRVIDLITQLQKHNPNMEVVVGHPTHNHWEEWESVTPEMNPEFIFNGKIREEDTLTQDEINEARFSLVIS